MAALSLGPVETELQTRCFGVPLRTSDELRSVLSNIMNRPRNKAFLGRNDIIITKNRYSDALSNDFTPKATKDAMAPLGTKPCDRLMPSGEFARNSKGGASRGARTFRGRIGQQAMMRASSSASRNWRPETHRR